MRKISISTQNLILTTSGLILLLVVGYFKFSQRPPKFANIFLPARPASLILEAPDSIMSNQNFTVEVKTDSKNQPINAVGLYLHFEPKNLQVLDIDTTSSFCQFYPERRFDNAVGTIKLSCGGPHPGVSDVNTVMKIKFMPVQPGKTNISVSPNSKVLLSDGKGTNILTEKPQLPITVLSGI